MQTLESNIITSRTKTHLYNTHFAVVFTRVEMHKKMKYRDLQSTREPTTDISEHFFSFLLDGCRLRRARNEKKNILKMIEFL